MLLLLLLLSATANVARTAADARLPRFDLRRYGARTAAADAGGGHSGSEALVRANTKAFDAAVAAIRAAGGGELYVPPGVWPTAGFALTSNMTLFLERGSKVLGHAFFAPSSSAGMCRGKKAGCYAATNWRPREDNCSSYPRLGWHPVGRPNDQIDERRTGYHPLLGGWGLRHVLITGRNGSLDWHNLSAWNALHGDAALAFGRPHSVLFSRSRDVAVENIAVLNSPFWSVRFWASRGVRASRLRIVNERDIFNGDGVDIDSSSDAIVESIYYRGGDDAVALKAGLGSDGAAFNMPTSNVTVQGIDASSRSSCWCIGSEVEGGIRDVTVRNVSCVDTDAGLRFKTPRTMSGNLPASNVSIVGARMDGITGTALTVTGFHDVKVRDVRGTGIHQPGDFSFGTGLVLEDVDFRTVELAYHCQDVNSSASADVFPPATCLMNR
eukprot:SAG31_NODE_689_length_12806_cov_5.358857_6_plen_440_part_00